LLVSSTFLQEYSFSAIISISLISNHNFTSQPSLYIHTVPVHHSITISFAQASIAVINDLSQAATFFEYSSLSSFDQISAITVLNSLFNKLR
jgi:hypothetical protein